MGNLYFGGGGYILYVINVIYLIIVSGFAFSVKNHFVLIALKLLDINVD